MGKKMRAETKAKIAISAATGCMFFLFSPLETYLTNISQFWYDIFILFPPMLLVSGLFFLFSCGIMSLLYRVGEKVFYYGMMLYVTAFICSYIQGNFLVKNLPLLDGSWEFWSRYPLERVKCIVMWVLVSGIVFLLGRKFYEKKNKIYKGITVVSVCMCLMFMVTIGVLIITEDGFQTKDNISNTTDHLFTMSEDMNYVIFCMDGVNAYDFDHVMENHPEYREAFRDFTYYEDTFGVAPFTWISVPFLLSGDLYEYDEEYPLYHEKVYTQSPFLLRLQETGYDIGIYIDDDELLPKTQEPIAYNDIVDYTYGVNNYWNFIRWNIQIVGYKYAPYDLKRICYVDTNAFFKLKKLADGKEAYSGENGDFYRYINEKEVLLTSQKIFRYIHIKGAHAPFIYNADVEEAADATYESSIESSITVAAAYLDKLRECGVYDNSVILVLSDHGWDQDRTQTQIDEGYNVLRWQVPVLFVKGVNENHDFQISKAPISYEDLPEALQKLMDGCEGDKVFPWKEGDWRERRSLVYTDGKLMEYVQTGEAWNGATATLEAAGE